MAITRVNLSSGGCNAIYASSSTWTFTLGFTPTVGNTLLLYISSHTSALAISSIVQGGSGTSWTLLTSIAAPTSNCNIYVYALNVTSGANSTVTLNLSVANYGFESFFEEISGLDTNLGSISVKTASNSALAQTTFTTTLPSGNISAGYSICVFAYYNGDAELGADGVAGNPTGGYTLLNTAPVTFSSSGWVGTVGTPPIASYFAGSFLSYKIISSSVTTGGTIDMTNLIAQSYVATTITFGPFVQTATASRRNYMPMILQQMQKIGGILKNDHL